MNRLRLSALVLFGPILLLLLVLALDAIGQCREAALFGLACELATFAAVFALVPAAVAGVTLMLRRSAPLAYRLGAGATLLIYLVVVLYGQRLIRT